MSPVLVVLLFTAAVVAAGVILTQRWITRHTARVRADEARWNAPSLSLERLRVHAEDGRLTVTMLGHHLRVVMHAERLISMSFAASSDTPGFVSEVPSRPHVFEFLVGEASCLPSAAAVPSVSPCAVPSGWVRLLLHTQPGELEPQVALMVDVPEEDAVDLLRWSCRHASYVQAVVKEEGPFPRLGVWVSKTAQASL